MKRWQSCLIVSAIYVAPHMSGIAALPISAVMLGFGLWAMWRDL